MAKHIYISNFDPPSNFNTKVEITIVIIKKKANSMTIITRTHQKVDEQECCVPERSENIKNNIRYDEVSPVGKEAEDPYRIKKKPIHYWWSLFIKYSRGINRNKTIYNQKHLVVIVSRCWIHVYQWILAYCSAS